MGIRHDPPEDWTLVTYDPWDREEASPPALPGRSRAWLALGLAIAGLLLLDGVIDRFRAGPPTLGPVDLVAAGTSFAALGAVGAATSEAP